MKWVASRKARLLRMIEDGSLTELDAYIKYGITGPELREWQEAYENRGLTGLKVNYSDRKRRGYVRK